MVTVAFGLTSATMYSVVTDFNTPKHGDTSNHRALDAGEGVLPRLSDNGRGLLLLMIDGLSVPAFESAVAGGRMPNLQRLMHERPTAAMNAISTFPSATSPSVQELLSGRYAEFESLAFPGAVHAFDREQRRIIRYVTEPDSWQWPVPTLFDVLDGRSAITVFEGRWDGPTSVLTQYNIAAQAILESIGASALAKGDAGPVQNYLDFLQSAEQPIIALVVLNNFDMAAHFHGPGSSEAQDALAACDHLIGKIIETMANTRGRSGGNVLDETPILLFGDHGMVESGQFIDLPRFFQSLNAKAVDASTIPHVMFRERLGRLWTEWPDTILVAGGSNVTQVYLRRPSGSWSSNSSPSPSEAKAHFKTPELRSLVKGISALQGIEHVMWADSATSVYIADELSEAKVIVQNSGKQKRFAYIVDDKATSDPFAYLADTSIAPLVCRGAVTSESCYHTSHTWSDRTAASRFPGAVPLLPKSFHPLNFAADLILTARPGYTFLRNQKGDHGNLERDAIMTPLILNGPGIYPCDETQVPRLVDIYPTASVLLGAAVGDAAFVSLDGRVLDCVREPVRNSGVE
jgi:hypothetical protein